MAGLQRNSGNIGTSMASTSGNSATSASSSSTGGAWLPFWKTFSNKFSISDLINGNGDRKGRKHISYDLLDTQDTSDNITSSNPYWPNLVDLQKYKTPSSPPGRDASSLSSSTSSSGNCHSPMKEDPSPLSQQIDKNVNPRITNTSSSRFTGGGKIGNQSSLTSSGPSSAFSSIFRGGGGRHADFNVKTKTFTFPNRNVETHQDREENEEGAEDGKKQKKKKVNANIRENPNAAATNTNWYDIMRTSKDKETQHDTPTDDTEDSSSSHSSSCFSSDYEDDYDDEGGTRCEICGCEKKYERLGEGEQPKHGVIKYTF